MNSTFRNYTNTKQNVINTYQQKHTHQTVFHTNKMLHDHSYNKNKTPRDIWSTLFLSNDIIDDSDPDINIGQIHHSFQVAERLRHLYPNDEQLHLIGLIHDLGKILLLKDLPQWDVVGDIYPVGCKFSDKIVFSKFFTNNIDNYNYLYNTKYGIYNPNCGLANVKMCFSHDEYLYQVLKTNKHCILEQKYLNIIRYHSFYAFHKENEYEYLANSDDMELKIWLQIFSQCDLYSKCDDEVEVDRLSVYYKTLVEKYCPGDYYW